MGMSERSEESRQRDRERSRKKRAEFRKRGLNSKGEPFKGQQKPSEQAKKFVIHNRTYKRSEPTVPKKGETREQRRARGSSIKGTPLALDLEERVRQRIKDME
jgi:hypothetical protein